MKREISFVVLGSPTAQKRHRSARRGTFIHNYDPSTKEKQDFLLVIQGNAPTAPIQGPIKMSMLFYFNRPKSHFGTGRNSGVLKKSAPKYYTAKPDTDNLIKFVWDSMSGIFFVDDKQINHVVAMKEYSDSPRVSIHMEW